MFMLALTYDIPRLMQAKSECRWVDRKDYASRTGLWGKTVGLIGLGNTGKEIARLAKQFQMRVLAWRRRPEPHAMVDTVYAADQGQSVRELLEQSDYVIVCASLNDETRKLLNEKNLGYMKKTAYLINVSRGGLVDEEALAAFLKEGRIAGAGLDCFTTEPLPKNSPLWQLPNVIITPHATPCLPDREERSLEYVLHNVQAWREGSKFVNQLTRRDIYTPEKS